MNNNISFHKSVLPMLVNDSSSDSWDGIVELFDKKNYADCIRGILNHVDKDIVKKYGNNSGTEFNIPHGSVIITILITESELHIKTPFLNVSSSKKVPLLRQVAQLNFNPLTISRIDLEGEQLLFKYSTPLENCEPYKIYDVLREICINADNYDDEFIQKFNATHIQAPKIQPFNNEQVELAYELTQLYIDEAFSQYEQLENKRLTQFLWDVIVLAILKIDFICSPQGILRNELEKTIVFMNSKNDYYQRVSAGKDFLKKLKELSKEEFSKALYFIDIFIPFKFNTNLDSIRNALKYAYETSEKEMQNKDYLGATLTLNYGILNLFYNNNVEHTIAQLLKNSLLQSSEKPVYEASKLLYDAVYKIMTQTTFSADPVATQNTTNTQSEVKGFFKKLFGK